MESPLSLCDRQPSGQIRHLLNPGKKGGAGDADAAAEAANREVLAVGQFVGF